MVNVKDVIDQDLFRYAGNASLKAFWKCYLTIPGFKYLYWYRKAQHWQTRSQRNGLYKPLFVFFELLMRHYGYKYGIDIPSSTSIAPGFYIGHFSGIVISPRTIIAKNVNISQCVTIGSTNMDFATIEEGVYLGPGSKIVGGVHIGAYAVIGANAVVVKDVPAGITVAGVPAVQISIKDSRRFIQNPV
ncbi:serine acetyltransferase [uncultured Rikenella sp.]|nr:serine acetyltransferase [uncultured Rikenella sp.]